MEQRQVSTPLDKFTKRGTESFRDVRPLGTRLADSLKTSASAFAIAMAAGCTWIVPSLVNVTLPGCMLLSAWVLTRRVVLPLNLPISSKRKDARSLDPGTRKPRRAAGTHYLGRDVVTGQQLWRTAADMRQHVTVPGTTGAGKTTSLLGQMANPLARGSGFILVDGKGDNTLYGDVLALARRFGREDDVLALSFLVASGVKDSCTFNPFAAGNADSIRELLASQLGEQTSGDSNGLFRGRAITLVGIMAPVLVYMRDVMGVPINVVSIRFSLDLKAIWLLATHKRFVCRNAQSGEIEEIPVPDIPYELIQSLLAYLGELPGYDISVDYNQQRSDEPSKQHGFAQFYFTATFAQLSGSLGHIFKTEIGDIDMRDVVLNRRILVVMLPSLENSSDTLAALGRICVASIRGMMAQLLGARLEGEPDEIFSLKAGSGDVPFHVLFDEIASYVTEGIDRMYSMGRGLNLSFWSAFQDVPGIFKKLGEATYTLLGNANLTIAMRLQDSSRTRQWLEETAGKASVTQVGSYQAIGTGQYRESQSAEVREVSRLPWNDIQRLIEGEAYILTAGTLNPAKLFRAEAPVTGPVRFSQPVMLLPPAPEDVAIENRKFDDNRENFLSGAAAAPYEHKPGPVLADLIATFKAKAAEMATPDACAAAAITAAGSQGHKSGQSALARADTAGPREPPANEFLPMLEALCSATATPVVDPGQPQVPISADLMHALLALEQHATGNRTAAHRVSLRAIAERDRAFDRPNLAPRPRQLSSQDMLKLLDQFCARLAA